MAFVVEDGTGLPDATSGVSEDFIEEYFEDKNDSAWTGTDTEGAMIRGTQAIDAIYGPQFPGLRKNGRNQGLEWPRTGAVDANGFAIGASEMPVEYKEAICEAAMRELTEPGSMMPDLDPGGYIKRLKAGSVEIERMGPAATSTAETFSAINAILAPLIGGGMASPYTARAVRA